MNNAVIFIKNEEEKQLTKAPYYGGNILLHSINELKKLHFDKIYVVGSDTEIPGAIRRENIRLVQSEIKKPGKCLLVSPLYPSLDSNDFRKLLNSDRPCMLTQQNEILGAFMIPNDKLDSFDKIQYQQIEINNKQVRRFSKEDAMKNRESSLKNVVIFSLSSNEELVKEVCSYLNIEPGKVAVNHFADGETLVELGESVRGKKVYVIQSVCKPVNERLMELLICVDALKRSSAAEINCVIPYFGYARQDRKAQPRQPITSKLVAKLIESAGANRVVIFDLHAQQIQGFFECPVDELTTIPMIGQYFLNKGYDSENVVVVSPDHGGVKRARNLAEILEVPIAIIDKRRPRANIAEAVNIIGDVANKDVIIVDDICDTGGSLVAACNILRDNGAKSVSVAITHGIFSNNCLLRITDSNIKELVVTNTIPLSKQEQAQCPKLTVLSIGWMLSKLILAVSGHKPVSEVYALYEKNNQD